MQIIHQSSSPSSSERTSAGAGHAVLGWDLTCVLECAVTQWPVRVTATGVTPTIIIWSQCTQGSHRRNQGDRTGEKHGNQVMSNIVSMKLKKMQFSRKPM